MPRTLIPTVDAISAGSYEEQRVVNHLGSLFVLGRGGTGKTTTMVGSGSDLFRLYGTVRWENNSCFRFYSSSRCWELRQPSNWTGLLVNSSLLRASTWPRRFRALSKACQYIFPPLPSLWSVADPLVRRVNRSETLDFLEDAPSLSVKDASPSLDSENHKMNLPLRFSELEDHHFPLFVSFDRVSSSFFHVRARRLLTTFLLLTSSSCAPSWKTTSFLSPPSRRNDLRFSISVCSSKSTGHRSIRS